MARTRLACPHCDTIIIDSARTHDLAFTCPGCGEWISWDTLKSVHSLSHSRGHHPPAAGGGTGGVVVRNFPHVALYMATSGGGYPLSSFATIDANIANKVARFQLLTINTTPFHDLYPNIIAELRARNPAQKLLSYDTYGERFFFATVGTMWKAEYDACLAQGFMVDTHGGTFASPSKPWPNIGKAATRSALQSIWASTVITPALTDGCMFDFMRGAITTLGGYDPPNYPSDPVADGFASYADQDAQTIAQNTLFLDNLRALRPSVLLVSNGPETAASSSSLRDGLLMENWPFSRGFNPGLAQYIAAGPYSIIATYDGPIVADGTQYSEGTNIPKHMRFGLACSCMGNGYHSFSPQRDLPASGPGSYLEWWYDEYSVTPLLHDLSGGASDATGAGVGWLGDPLEGPVQVQTDVYRRRFTNGVVLLNGTGQQ